MSTKLLNFKHYDTLPEETKSAILALSVLIDRIRHLPKKDRDELFSLLQDWRVAKDPEDQLSLRHAMEEILSQIPVKTKSMFEPVDVPMAQRRKKWAAHVGKKIKQFREAAGLTQTALAAKAKLPQSHVSRLENAEYSPTNFTLTKIADALGVTVGEIDPCAD